MFKLKLFAQKIFGTAITTVRYGAYVYCFKEYVADFYPCYGPSMQPTLKTNDVVVVERISALKHSYNYGDIVVSKSLSNPKEYICKRITGLPGDKIKVNLLKTQYVPKGHVWLEGDNRDNSLDSRSYGPVPQGLIQGRVIFKIWPLSDITMLTVKADADTD